MGSIVKVDEKVDYGSNLNGFMREIVEADHALLNVDESYIELANNLSDSGVGIETKWIKSASARKLRTWLSVLFVENPKCLLPEWLLKCESKGFNFNFS